ncbi:MAG: hypothetical protein KGH66_00525 [Candidatus Micrarchaeota archaeon]|nr:hypothetical protein [Candidatus Micrarchaeota archaeon]
MKAIKKRKNIRWSAVAKRAMRNKEKTLELMDKLLAKSRLTEKDALMIGRKINREVARRHRLK